MKAILLTSCPIGRYIKGEVGILLTNDSSKYQYKIELSPVNNTSSTGFLAGVKTIARVYYFYENEVKIIQ